MPGQVIGKVNVQVNSQTGGGVSSVNHGTVNVQVNSQTGGRVNTINYGIRSLKGSTDLSMVDVKNEDVIIYNANTDSFVVAPAYTVLPDLDAGFF